MMLRRERIAEGLLRFAAVLLFGVCAWTVVGVFALGASGCSGAQVQTAQDAVDRHELAFKAATQLGTLKAIRDRPAVAVEVANVAGALASALEGGQLLALDELEERVRAEINWAGMSDEEAVVWNNLIGAVRQELELAIREEYAGLSPDEASRRALFLAARVLRWVEEAAVLKLPK